MEKRFVIKPSTNPYDNGRGFGELWSLYEVKFFGIDQNLVAVSKNKQKLRDIIPHLKKQSEVICPPM